MSRSKFAVRLLQVFLLLVSLCALPALPPSQVRDGIAEARGRSGAVHVRGYYRSNGTYVQPHYRSAPDGNFYNNWSTKGNVNPYTGQQGTKVSPSSGYSSNGGTALPRQYSSAPDERATYDLSTRGNIDSDSGRLGPWPYSQRQLAVVDAWEYWANNNGSGAWELQSALLAAGEDPGPVDGVVGKMTLQALASFLRRVREPTFTIR